MKARMYRTAIAAASLIATLVAVGFPFKKG